MTDYKKILEEQKKADEEFTKVREAQKGTQKENGSIPPKMKGIGQIPDESERDKSITIGDYRFALGNESEYLGHPIVSGFKITGAAKFKKETGKYQMTLPFTIMARIIGEWLKQPENKAEFNRLLDIEKSRQIGAPSLE